MDKVQTTVKEFISQQQVLAQKLFMMGILSQKAFKLSQVWLELGQLVNHFLMVSCVTSRIWYANSTVKLKLFTILTVLCF